MSSQYSQKYALVQFFEDTSVGASFHMADWPMHTTLADVFAITTTEQLHADLQKYAKNADRVWSKVIGEGVLGTTQVWLLEQTPGLLRLHRDIIGILEKHGAVFNTPEFVKDGYIPHITKQKTDTMKPGSEVVINTLSLIDMFPNGDWQTRTVLMQYPSSEA